MLNFFVALPMYLLSQHYLVQQSLQMPFPPPPAPPSPPIPSAPALPTAPEGPAPSASYGRLLLQSEGSGSGSSPPTTMPVTFQCLWSTDGVSSLCGQTAKAFHITIVSAILVLTAWLVGPLTAFTREEGPLRPLMLGITVTAVAGGAILDLIITIVVGSAAYRMWDAFGSLDAAGLPGNQYRVEVHGLTVTVAVVSGLAIPLNPSLLMLFTRAVERYVDRKWPSRIPHDELSHGGKTAAEILGQQRQQQQVLAVSSAPAGAPRVSAEGGGGRRSGSGYVGTGTGTGTGPTQRSSRSVTRGQEYKI